MTLERIFIIISKKFHRHIYIFLKAFETTNAMVPSVFFVFAYLKFPPKKTKTRFMCGQRCP